MDDRQGIVHRVTIDNYDFINVGRQCAEDMRQVTLLIQSWNYDRYAQPWRQRIALSCHSALAKPYPGAQPWFSDCAPTLAPIRRQPGCRSTATTLVRRLNSIQCNPSRPFLRKSHCIHVCKTQQNRLLTYRKDENPPYDKPCEGSLASVLPNDSVHYACPLSSPHARIYAWY